MADIAALIEELVTANRILATEGIVDAFGHVSVRHPDQPGKFLLSRARAPELITAQDIMVFELDGTPPADDSRKPYLERYIHGALYEARPDVMAVVHSHSRSVVPFGLVDIPLRPVVHSCATIGYDIPIWDAQDAFGDTNLLISDMAMGRDFAKVVGANTSGLMRGHGSTVTGRTLKEVIYTAYYLEVNAGLQMQAAQLGAGRPVKFLTRGEVEKIVGRIGDGKAGEGYSRAWDYWCRRAGVATAPS